jgi:hypothetical protein
MGSFASRWSNIGLQLKLQILIQSFLMVILVGTQLWLSNQMERHLLIAAEERTMVVADGVINSLNTLMDVNVGGKDVISDEKARTVSQENWHFGRPEGVAGRSG